MLQFDIPAEEYFNESNNQFIVTRELHVELEHSLLSISKWESRWKKSFLATKEKTVAETKDYIRCMCSERLSNDDVDHIVEQKMNEINAYLNEQHTATTVKNRARLNHQVVTSELVYSWMVSLGIPFQPCETWNFSRLMMLIQVCNVQNQPQKKMSRAETANMYRNLNASRRARLGTKG